MRVIRGTQDGARNRSIGSMRPMEWRRSSTSSAKLSEEVTISPENSVSESTAKASSVMSLPMSKIAPSAPSYFCA